MNRNQPGMARAYENTMETGVKNQFTADDRHSRKLARFLKGARFRYKAAFEKIGFAVDRNPERLRLSIRILPGKEHDWVNLLSQTSAYAHQIAFTWHNPRKIHVGARLDKIDSRKRACLSNLKSNCRLTRYNR